MRLSTRTIGVLGEVERERLRQDELWGEQNWSDGEDAFRPAYAEVAQMFQELNPYRAADGTLTWSHILGEEVAEAVAESDVVKLREELVQVAAVAVAWIECIDRRTE
jgi:malonyl CoA-acyl carrier protein transacylase